MTTFNGELSTGDAREMACLIAKNAFASKRDLAHRPYIEHLERVAKAVDVPGNPERFIVAMLHDLLEDCEQWNPKVLSNVGFHPSVICSIIAITKQDGESYDDYIQRVANDEDARAVKLADLSDNMDTRRLLRLDEKMLERLKKYHGAYHFLKNYKK